MEIHRFEKLWFVVALLLIVALIATISYGAVGAGIQMISDEGGTVNPDELGEHERFGDPGVHQVNETHYEVNMVLFHPSFQPNEIEVPEGSTVEFYVTAGDVIHGMDILDTNVNVMVIPGQVSQFTVEFDEPAEYGIVCNEYCGSQHHIMEAKLTVVPEDEWEGVE